MNNDWKTDALSALEAFVAAARLAEAPLFDADMQIEFSQAPHERPTGMPKGKMAVYGFWGDGEWLKIGKAGPKSGPRFAYQHYKANSANSTLAGSLIKDRNMIGIPGFDGDDPGDWVQKHTHRMNIFMSAEQPRELLSFLEAFLHLRLRPRYEY